MKKFALATLAAVGLTGSAHAAVISLQGVSPSGPSRFTFNYQSTLSPDEGLRTGDRFVIFDFAGYVNGSIFSNSASLVASVENQTQGVFFTPGMNDDAAVSNLVFTYTGPNFRPEGPLPPFSFLIGADSIFGQTVVDAFFTLTTKNNPIRDRGSKVYTFGSVSVPGGVGVVPEPASWALMIGGLGIAGASMRRRNRVTRVLA